MSTTDSWPPQGGPNLGPCQTQEPHALGPGPPQEGGALARRVPRCDHVVHEPHVPARQTPPLARLQGEGIVHVGGTRKPPAPPARQGGPQGLGPCSPLGGGGAQATQAAAHGTIQRGAHAAGQTQGLIVPTLHGSQRVQGHRHEEVHPRALRTLFQAAGQAAPEGQTQVRAAPVLEGQDPRPQSIMTVILPQADQVRPRRWRLTAGPAGDSVGEPEGKFQTADETALAPGPLG